MNEKMIRTHEKEYERNSSLELLRILAMIMIVFHHFAVHGGFVYDYSVLTIPRFWVNFISMGGKIGVDVFVLISGYFLVVDREPVINVRRIFKFWFQIYFYSIIIVGISGGKDSAVCAALMCKAIGSENVIGLTLPCHSNDEDKIDAKLISDYYGFKLINFDLTETFDCFKKELSNIGNFTSLETENCDINLKPRLRMSTL